MFNKTLFVGTVDAGPAVVGIVFVFSVIASQVITESSTILAKYLPFSQLHVAGLQIYFFCTQDVPSDFLINVEVYLYSTFDLNYIFYHQIYIYIRMMYALLMLSIHLFL